MLEDKGGQVTVFVIVAVLVVSGVVLYFVLFDSGKDQSVNPEVREVKDYVDSCLRNSLRDSIEKVASRGGYYSVPEDSVDFYSSEPEGIPRYLHANSKAGNSSIPSKETIENAISEDMQDRFTSCVGDFGNLSKRYSISGGNLEEVSTSLYENEVEISATYPMTIEKGDVVSKIDSFEVTLGSNIYRAYSFSKMVVDKHEGDQLAPLGYLSNLAYENGFNFDTVRVGDDMIYFLYFNEGEENLNYAFAVNYEWVS